MRIPLTFAWLALPFCYLTTLTARAQSYVSLGRAANYAVVGTSLDFSNVTSQGNVGVAANGSIDISSPSSVRGNLYLGAGATRTGSGLVSGSTLQPFDVNGALSDAFSASNMAANLSPSLVFSSITGPLIIQPSGLQTVVNVTGDISLGGSDSISFQGRADQKLILNVFGKFILGGSATISGGAGSGAGSDDILINLIGTSGTVSTQVNNVVSGTLLSPQRSMVLHSVSGAVVGGTAPMKFQSGAVVTYVPFSAVPEPSSLMLCGAAMILALTRRSRR